MKIGADVTEFASTPIIADLARDCVTAIARFLTHYSSVAL